MGSQRTASDVGRNACNSVLETRNVSLPWAIQGEVQSSSCYTCKIVLSRLIFRKEVMIRARTLSETVKNKSRDRRGERRREERTGEIRSLDKLWF